MTSRQSQRRFAFDEWCALADRLPGGISTTSRVWISSREPAGAVRLAPGSAWLSVGSELVVVVGGPAERDRTAADLLRYLQLADALASELLGRPDVIELLEDAQQDPRLELYLGTQPGQLAELPADLFSELARMARGSVYFDVAVTPELDEDLIRAEGQAFGQALVNAAPSGKLLLVVTDAPCLVDLFAGLELGGWLAEWIVAADWPPGIVPALRDGDPELEAVVARRLAATKVEVGRALREARPSFVYAGPLEGGFVADAPRLGISRSEAHICVVAAPPGSQEACVGAAGTILGARQVVGIAGVFAASGGSGIVAPRAIVTQHDGHVFSNEVSDAWRRNRNVRVVDRAELSARCGPMELARAFRRALASGRIDAAIPFAMVLYEATSQTLVEARAPAAAGRMAVELVLGLLEGPAKSSKTVRFRA
ncbi:MAG: hypothetical protein HY791_27995 [Deltaproteobacteria bacterium]|nr:hypothetical protein [Deltaproteobacteria bacterium]